MSRECQEKTMVAVGVNKAAEQYMILDEHTKEELASGKYHDQRRGFFGTPARSPASDNAPANSPGNSPSQTTAETPDKVTGEAPRPASRVKPPRSTVSKPVRHPWSRSQQKLALLYNEQGLRPDEIAAKLGLSTYIVTQIILNARSRGKL
jgi:hypothetical protein